MVAAACGSDTPPKYAPVIEVMEPAEPGLVDAGPPAPSICTINTGYLATRKSCEADADCELVTYRPTCCANQSITAVASGSAEEVRTCAAQGPIVCGRCASTPTRAEDGRVSIAADGSDVIAECIAGTCQSSVGRRGCGTHQNCKSSEVCVSYEGATDLVAPDLDGGDNALLTYVCRPNPCPGVLDCSCAKPLCGTGGAALACEIERNADSDVACVPFGS
jgi:hypothetical protein